MAQRDQPLAHPPGGPVNGNLDAIRVLDEGTSRSSRNSDRADSRSAGYAAATRLTRRLNYKAEWP